jgi:hypothetical protein
VKRYDWLVPLVILAFSLIGCSAAAPATDMPDGQSLKEKAALEATAIVERAEATAIVLRAQTTAAALIRGASGPTSTPVQTSASVNVLPAPATPMPAVTRLPAPASAVLPSPSSTVAMTSAAEFGATEVELLGVGFAAEGNFIIVNYRADPRVAQSFWPGVLSVIDEATGAIYNEVPNMPVIGPLIGRPKEAGQLGYVMLVNTPPGLRAGALVTVVLGDFKQEHVTVTGDG